MLKDWDMYERLTTTTGLAADRAGKLNDLLHSVYRTVFKYCRLIK